MCWITAGRRLGNFGSPLGCLALIPDILSLEYLAPSGATLRTTICCKRRRCLEDSFWIGLKEIARDSHLTLSKLVNKVDTERINANLSSALRVYVFQHFRGGQTNGRGQADAMHAAVQLDRVWQEPLSRSGR